MNIRDWLPVGLTGLISLQSQICKSLQNIPPTLLSRLHCFFLVKRWINVLFILKFSWSTVNLQRVDFCCTSERLSCTQTHPFSYCFPFWFVSGLKAVPYAPQQDLVASFLCMLMIVGIRSPRTPNSRLPHASFPSRRPQVCPLCVAVFVLQIYLFVSCFRWFLSCSFCPNVT